MLIRTQSSGTARKRLVEDVSELLELPARYLGAPTMAYAIGDVRVLRDGSVETEGEVPGLLDMLERRGHEPEPESAAALAALTFELPLDAVDTEKMEALLAAKGTLIEHALGIESLPMVVEEDRVSFPWYESLPEAAEREAALALVCAMAKMSKDLKRVTSRPKKVENEKYAFRCFLLRLGFIGDEKKEARRALLRRLEGNSAFREGKEDGR